MKEYSSRLDEIWTNEYMNALPQVIKERGYMGAECEPKEILITGFNPSFRKGDQEGSSIYSIQKIWRDSSYDPYWSRIKRILQNEKINLLDKTGYLDLFYFRERHQDLFRKEILSTPEGVTFAADQLNITMHLLEEISQPKVIVVKNKESWAYWGKLYEEMSWVWMGYHFEHLMNLKCGELCRIDGLIDSPKRIAQEILETNLRGTFVLFTKHLNQYTPLNEMVTAELLQDMILSYDSEKTVRSLGK